MQPARRLHISPLNSRLLPTVLPGPLLAKASNISFHTIQTFPEKDYGYIELPEMEADKLKKKLHGSTLKGSKMRVEEARPKQSKKVDQKPIEASAEEDQSEKTKRKRKRQTQEQEQGVISGHEMQTRKVKRGWTDPSVDSKPSRRQKDKAEKKSKPQSITGGTECLFKATLPPNAATVDNPKNGKVKKRKRGESTRDVVVHEFANTTKHASFLRDEFDAISKKPATEYLEGKGWVDEDGNLVEVGPKRRRSKLKPDTKGAMEEVKKPGSRRSSRLEAPGVEITASKTLETLDAVADNETSSSGTSSDESGSGSDQSHRSPSPPGDGRHMRDKVQKRRQDIGGDHGVEIDQVERLSITRSSATPPLSQEQPPTSAPSADAVHPLEALFKRPNTAASHTPKKPNLEVSTSFNFFDPDIDEQGNQGLLVPQTPFTQQDIRQRRQRSAAPTPDTAAPGKTFGDIWEGTSDISAGEDDIETSGREQSGEKLTTPDIKEEKPESDFSKWFWEHRGENNRAWKRRRREAAKEKRQKENKERRP